ncbi:MAG: hypothetical protein ACXW30_01820 [Micavibrio sp.]
MVFLLRKSDDLFKTPLFTGILSIQDRHMFKNLFNFSKTRSLKESIGFYIFYTTIALAISGLAGLFA